MVLLASVTQTNEYWRVGMMESSTYTWDMVWNLDPASPASRDSIHPNNQPGRTAKSKNWSTPNKSFRAALACVHKTKTLER